jgi:hypothetical protein
MRVSTSIKENILQVPVTLAYQAPPATGYQPPELFILNHQTP